MGIETSISGKVEFAHRNMGQPHWQWISLLIVLGYEAAGCLLGGSLLVAAPDGSYMDMPVHIMNGIFPDFLIPGVILFALGILNAFAFLSVLRKSSYDWFMAVIALGGLAVWFVFEIIILQELHWLHFMWGFPVFLGLVVIIPLIALRNDQVKLDKAFLSCGILSSIWYSIINIYVPIQDDGYSVVTQTVSELSAIGAPTRILWIVSMLLYPLLFVAFGWGVLKQAAANHSLRVVGVLIIIYSVFNFYWPPMQMRGNQMAMTDILHISWGVLTLLLMLAMMGLGAKSAGKKFRLFTLVSVTLFFVFGVLTGLESPNIATNEPTPMIGVWERINIAIFMLWVAVFAIMLLREERLLNPLKDDFSLIKTGPEKK